MSSPYLHSREIQEVTCNTPFPGHVVKMFEGKALFLPLPEWDRIPPFWLFSAGVFSLRNWYFTRQKLGLPCIKCTVNIPIKGLKAVDSAFSIDTWCQKGKHMEKAHIRKIEEAMGGQKLLAACKRYRPGVGFTCKAIDIGLDSFVECLEKDSHRCPFSMTYANCNFCKSPARVYAAKELKT